MQQRTPAGPRLLVVLLALLVSSAGLGAVAAVAQAGPVTVGGGHARGLPGDDAVVRTGGQQAMTPVLDSETAVPLPPAAASAPGSPVRPGADAAEREHPGSDRARQERAPPAGTG